MSYATNRWVSEYTWRNIQLELCSQITGQIICPWPSTLSVESSTQRASSSQGVAPREIDLPSDVLMVAGLITDTVQLGSIYRVPQSVVPTSTLDKLVLHPRGLQPTTRTFALQLLDAADGLLHTEPLTPAPVSDGVTPGSMFELVIPYDANTAKIQIVSDTIPVASRLVSANPPTATVLSPNGGETIADTMVVSWEGDDPDGDVLSYTVQYSADLGQTWRVLASEVPTTSITVDSSLLPGSLAKSLVRVIANDGVNTGTDQCDAPFTVPPRSPLAVIRRPGAWAVIDLGDAVTLRGLGFDPKDGQIPGASLSWTIHGLGEVATGKEAMLFDLEFGTYVATLTATDSDGQSASQTVTFRVGVTHQAFLPVVLR